MVLLALGLTVERPRVRSILPARYAAACESLKVEVYAFMTYIATSLQRFSSNKNLASTSCTSSHLFKATLKWAIYSATSGEVYLVRTRACLACLA